MTAANITLDGDISPFRRKMREARQELSDFGKDGQRSVDGLLGPLRKLDGLLVGLGVTLGAGSLLGFAKQTIDASDELSKLSQRTGVAIGTLAAFKQASELADVPQEKLGESLGRLNIVLGEAQAGNAQYRDTLRQLGVTARDPEQAFLQIAEAVQKIEDPTKRAQLLNKVFGESYRVLIPLLAQGRDGLQAQIEASRDYATSQEKLGTQAEQFNDNITRLQQNMQGFAASILADVVPSLNEWFNSTTKLVDRFGVLTGVLAGIGSAVIPGLDTSKLAGSVSIAAARKELKSAREELAVIESSIKSGTFGLIQLALYGSQAEMERKGEFLKSKVKNLTESIRQAEERSKPKQPKSLPVLDTGATAAEAAAARAAEARAAEARRREAERAAQAQAKTRAEVEKIQADAVAAAALAAVDADEAALRQRVALHGAAAADIAAAETDLANRRYAIQRTALEREAQVAAAGNDAAGVARVQTQREALEQQHQAQLTAIAYQAAQTRAQQAQQLASLETEARSRVALDAITVEQDRARGLYNSRQISYEQLLALETSFEARRTAIQQQALEERRALIDPANDPVEFARISAEIEQLQRDHLIRQNQINLEMAEQSRAPLNAVFANIESGLSGVLSQLGTGVRSFADGTRSVFLLVAQSVQQVTSQMIAKWLAEQAKATALRLGFMQAEKAAETAASATTIAAKTAETTAVVGSNAAQAASGAAASQASIPFAGPVLALAAMAAMFAAVSALRPSKSAAGGYDIPRGLNPLVQTHAEEMILPSPLANAVREMAAGGAKPAQGGGVKNVILFEPERVADELATTSGFERAVLQVAHRNPGAFGG